MIEISIGLLLIQNINFNNLKYCYAKNMNDIVNIKDKKKNQQKADKIARDILKPTCEEDLPEDEYPEIKEED